MILKYEEWVLYRTNSIILKSLSFTGWIFSTFTSYPYRKRYRRTVVAASGILQWFSYIFYRKINALAGVRSRWRRSSDDKTQDHSSISVTLICFLRRWVSMCFLRRYDVSDTSHSFSHESDEKSIPNIDERVARTALYIGFLEHTQMKNTARGENHIKLDICKIWKLDLKLIRIRRG